MFAYSYQTIDDFRRAATTTDWSSAASRCVPLITVKKTSARAARFTPEAVLRNGLPARRGSLISAGRFDAKDLGPGATKTFSFVYVGRADDVGDDYQLELSVGDTTLGESVHRWKIKVKIAAPAPPARPNMTGATSPGLSRRRPAARGGCGERAGGGSRAQGDRVQGNRQAGRVHARRARHRSLGVHGVGRSEVGRDAAPAAR